jgi:ABC-type sugar transport system substrate-binding protein
MGARKAFAEIAESERARWMKIPVTGCDGMPKTGQTWVRNGALAATIFIRPNTDLAIEMLAEWFKGGTQLPEWKITAPESVPALQDLAKGAGGKMQRSAGV